MRLLDSTIPEPVDRGATSTEYAVLIGFIASAVIAGVSIFGTALNGYYVSLANQVASMLGRA